MIVPVLSSTAKIVRDVINQDTSGTYIFNTVESCKADIPDHCDHADIYEDYRKFRQVTDSLAQGKIVGMQDFPTFQAKPFEQYQRKQLNSIIIAAIAFKNSSGFSEHSYRAASILNVVHGILEYLVTSDKYVYLAIDPDTHLYHITEGAMGIAVKTALQQNDLDGLLAIYQELQTLSLGYDPHDRGILGAVKTMRIIRKKTLQ